MSTFIDSRGRKITGIACALVDQPADSHTILLLQCHKRPNVIPFDDDVKKQSLLRRLVTIYNPFAFSPMLGGRL